MSDQDERQTRHQGLTENLEMRSKDFPATHRMTKPERVRVEDGTGY